MFEPRVSSHKSSNKILLISCFWGARAMEGQGWSYHDFGIKYYQQVSSRGRGSRHAENARGQLTKVLEKTSFTSFLRGGGVWLILSIFQNTHIRT